MSSILGPTYYKFNHLTGYSFPDLSPDDVDELIGTKEALERELRRKDPGCSVSISRDGTGYHLIVRTENSPEVDDHFNGWKVVTEGYPL